MVFGREDSLKIPNLLLPNEITEHSGKGLGPFKKTYFYIHSVATVHYNFLQCCINFTGVWL